MVSPLLPTSQNILRAFPYVMFLALLLVQYSSTIITHIKYSSVMGHHRRRSQCPLQIQPLEETTFCRRFMNMTVKLECSTSPLHKHIEFTMNYISLSVTKVEHLDVRCLICDPMVVWKGAVSFLAASRRTSWQRSWIYRRGGVALLKAVAPHAILRTTQPGGAFFQRGQKGFCYSVYGTSGCKVTASFSSSPLYVLLLLIWTEDQKWGRSKQPL